MLSNSLILEPLFVENIRNNQTSKTTKVWAVRYKILVLIIGPLYCKSQLGFIIYSLITFCNVKLLIL